MKTSRVIWVGATSDKEYLNIMTAKGNRQSTAYNVQEKFIKGLRKNGVRVDTLNGHVMPPFPHYQGIRIPARIWNNNNEKNVDASFWNLPLLNLYFKSRGMIRAARILKVEKEDVLIVYSLHSPFLKTASWLKKRKGCKVIVIIPDLPEYMNSQQNIIRQFMKRIDRLFINKYLCETDGYVMFSRNMEQYLPYKRCKIVIEGILEYDEQSYLKKIENIKKLNNVIMYSGNLNLSEGIKELLDIFSLVKKEDCQLWITGVGDGEEMICQRAKQDERIKYFGYFDEYTKVVELQEQAKVLVAMVTPQNPKSEVFFPSKIMEYLNTGREVVCYKLGGIPDEYDRYLRYFDYSSNEESASLLESMLNLTESEMKENARKRVALLKEKDLLAQTHKLGEFIDEVCNSENL